MKTVYLLILILSMLPAQWARAETGRHLFILSGQSNMRQPLPESFKQAVSAVFGEDRVIVVTLGHPSQPIKRWYKAWTPPEGMEDEKPEGNGGLYDTLVQHVARATHGKELASVTYIWIQGEADAGKGWGGVYEKSFYGILTQFKTDLHIEKINFVIGRINDYWLSSLGVVDGDLVRATQVKIGEQGPNGDWVDTDDLNAGVNPWGGYSFGDGHFPPAGYRVMGQRFAYKACRLIAPNMKLDERIFQESFFDSADDVQSHLAIGKSIAGTSPDPKDVGDKKTLAVLLDGKYGSADLDSAAWIGFAPNDSAVELVVDLGEPVVLDSVAVNLFVSSAASARFPAKIIISTSTNGETYQLNNRRHNTISFNSKALRHMKSTGIEPQALLVLADQNKAVGRYIKIEIAGGKEWIFLDEIIVNPDGQQPQ